MNWSRIRLCDSCGAACPEDATACVRCGGRQLSKAQGPSKPVPDTPSGDWSKTPMRDLVSLLGVAELGLGRQILVNPTGPNEEVEVGALWHARIMPSFHDWALLGLVRFDAFSFRGEPRAGGIRAGMIVFAPGNEIGKAEAAAALSRDPLRTALQSVNLIPEEHRTVLDGLSYSVSVLAPEVKSQLDMHNPSNRGLLAIQEGLVATVRQIVLASGSDELKPYLTMLEGYCYRQPPPPLKDRRSY